MINCLSSLDSVLSPLKRLNRTRPVLLLWYASRDFPGGPMAENLPSNAGDSGSIPGRGTKSPHVAGQLSLHAATTGACVLQQEKLEHHS